MMVHENDKLVIPEEYRQMSVPELRQEKEKIYKSLNNKKTSEVRKKVTSSSVVFNI